MKYIYVTINFFVALQFAECALDAYISGGSFATYSQYPHSVFLLIHCEYLSGCGASILNQNIVLTAAHCTERCDKEGNSEIHIKYGHHNIMEMKTTYMDNYVEHERYDTESVINDICLMSTKDKIELNDTVKRVIIMKRPPVMEFGYVSGWGLDEYGEITGSLKHTKSTIQPSHVCDVVFGPLPRGLFCAGPITGLGTAQEGDSGGALVFDGYIQIGLVSHNVPEYSLVAYTNVSYYLKWIKKHSKKLYCTDKVMNI